MKKSLALLLVIFSTSTSAFAQELAEGFIVKTSGDTIRGFIRERFDWSKVPDMEIAGSPTSEVVKIPIDDVDNFYLKKYDSYFLRRVLDIDKKPVETSRLELTPARIIQTDTVVIRLLVKGAVNLYDYVDEGAKKHFFVQKGSGEIEELAYVKYLAVGGSRLVEQPFFVGTLKSLLFDCDKVGNISSVYDEKPLKKVINQYNSCFSPTQYEIERVKSSLSFSVFAGGGPSFPTYKGVDLVNDAIGLDPGTADFSKTSIVLAGVNIEVVSGHRSRFVPGLQISYLKSGEVKAEREFLTSRRDMWMDFSMADAKLSLKYFIVDRTRWKIYARASFGAQLLLSATSKYTMTDFTFNTVTEPKDFAIYKKGGYAHCLGFGTSFDRLSLEVLFRQNIAVATVTAEGIVSSVTATVGFRLTKN